MKQLIVFAALAGVVLSASAQQSPFGDPVAVPKAPVQFVVQRSDGTFRSVLQRWAGKAGWEFGNDYWTVGRDVPVIADAELGADFKEAVRSLLASTELTDLPLKPCFYSNHVLRVVRRAEKCDRTKD